VPAEEQPLGDPVDLRTALQFAALLAVVLALASVARERLGDAGVNALAHCSPVFTMVDAIHALGRRAGAPAAWASGGCTRGAARGRGQSPW
jgi:uncharacterized membrane protein (DUF4010 family)